MTASRNDLHQLKLPLASRGPSTHDNAVEAILDGRQPVELTAHRLKRLRDLPSFWDDQRRLLGFS